MQFLLLLLVLLLIPSSAILPTAQIVPQNPSSSPIYAAEAFYGPSLPADNSLNLESSFPPSNDRGLCASLDDPVTNFDPPSSEFAFLVPRGNCTFEHKSRRAELYGASAVVVYNNAEQMFFGNATESEINGGLISSFPTSKVDYECSNGEAHVPKSSLSIPYYSRSNDDLFAECSSSKSCSSDRCVATGEVNSDDEMQVCCMWDLHQYLYPDYSQTEPSPSIPSVFITSSQYDAVQPTLPLTLQIEQRPRPKYNASSFLIWAWGCFVAVVASRISGSELSRALQKTQEKMRRGSASTTPPSESSDREGTRGREDDIGAGESMELTAKHALGFLVMSSVTLLILFYLNIYAIITVLYAFGCSGALSQVMIYPFFRKIRSLTGWRKLDEICCTLPLDIGDCTYLDVTSTALGYGFGILWYCYALKTNASSYFIYWFLQDIFGLCMCTLFLSVIRLPSLRVASFLLVAAFVYDIFFVFISPIIFEKSVMITVATGGDGPTTDPMVCEKYPDTDGCKVPNPLPMLFSIPKINDYQGGSSLLGLGDIVLPGLLMSFACRLDLSKALVSLSNGEEKDKNVSGYFFYVCVGYAMGLMMANVAVYVMEMGQPALLYLVPCTLGVIIKMSMKRGEFEDVFKGPAVMNQANEILDEIEGGVGGSGSERGSENGDALQDGERLLSPNISNSDVV
ncbi:hypothetical protein TrST_g5426 [Triparma strigata]|uniref:PA domain-containing protein n=1 Tax=Triparma strigata TaxID=1606541 RepID=A0A9W7E9V0_9STRA|nr:hypothetical protein TrST_g5426 [Triparma strigata]